MSTNRKTRLPRGAALLTVLWLTAALSAIAFSVANTVRGEIERTSTSIDGVRAYYLATGAVDRTICYMLWGPSFKSPDGSPRYWDKDTARMYHRFPTGDAIVELIPATGKLNINLAREEEIFRLLMAIGAPGPLAEEITAGILDWRKPMPGSALTPFDQFYLSRTPSFRARHASLGQIEEVLLVKGMTPELFYGTYARGPQGGLHRRPGLRDCASVYGYNLSFDVNSAEAPLLAAIQVSPPAIDQIVQMRRQRPLRPADLNRIRGAAGPGGSRLVVGGNSIFTLRATARLRLQNGRLSDLRRSVAATVKFFGPEVQPPYQVLRWYDQAPADAVYWP